MQNRNMPEKLLKLFEGKITKISCGTDYTILIDDK